MNRNYGGIIWTNHALQRLEERGVKQGDAWATFKRPESTEYSKANQSWVFQRIIGNETIEVVAKKNEKREWIILSVWSKNVGKRADFKSGDSYFKRFIRKLVGFVRMIGSD